MSRSWSTLSQQLLYIGCILHHIRNTQLPKVFRQHAEILSYLFTPWPHRLKQIMLTKLVCRDCASPDCPFKSTGLHQAHSAFEGARLRRSQFLKHVIILCTSQAIARSFYQRSLTKNRALAPGERMWDAKLLTSDEGIILSRQTLQKPCQKTTNLKNGATFISFFHCPSATQDSDYTDCLETSICLCCFMYDNLKCLQDDLVSWSRRSLCVLCLH